MDALSWLDILALLLLTLSAVAGLFKGLARELISLVCVIAGFILALSFHLQMARVFVTLGVEEMFAGWLGFLVIFLVSIVGGALLIRVIHSALRLLRLRWADRVLGGLFGLARGWLIDAVIFLSLAAFPISSEVLARSRTAEFFLTSASLMLSLSSSDLKQRFAAGFEQVNRIWIKETLENGGSD